MTAKIIQFPTKEKKTKEPKNSFLKSPVAVVKCGENLFLMIETDSKEFKNYELVDHIQSYFKDCVITFNGRWFERHGENILIPMEAQF